MAVRSFDGPINRSPWRCYFCGADPGARCSLGLCDFVRTQLGFNGAVALHPGPLAQVFGPAPSLAMIEAYAKVGG